MQTGMERRGLVKEHEYATIITTCKRIPTRPAPEPHDHPSTTQEARVRVRVGGAWTVLPPTPCIP